MRALDTPIRLAAGRTLREIILIGHGVGATATALYVGDTSWNIYAYVGATALFAGRFFAARVLYLSMLVGALALQLAGVLLPQLTLAMKAPVLLQILGCMLLLCGRDLVRRFDDDGRGIGPIRNFWRDLSLGQRRHIAWGVHLIGATAGLLHHTWMNVRPVPTWLYAGVAACTVVGFLYIWGRAIAAPAAVAVGTAVAWHLAPHLDGAVQVLRMHPAAVPAEVARSAHYVLVAFVCAAAAALIAVPWTVRWLALAFRGASTRPPE
jgi:hypothetical protein